MSKKQARVLWPGTQSAPRLVEQLGMVFQQFQLPSLEFTVQRDGGTVGQLGFPCSQCGKPIDMAVWDGPVCPDCRGKTRKLADVDGLPSGKGK